MEGTNFEGNTKIKMAECDEIMQSSLQIMLSDLLVFLKSNKINESFRCNCIRDIIKLGANCKRPSLNLNNMPGAMSAIHKLLMYLSEGILTSLEDELLCAEAVIALLCMFPEQYALKIILQCLTLKTDSKGVLELTIGDDLNCTFVAVHPLEFKLCLSRAILQNRSFLAAPVLLAITEPIAVACYQYSHLTSLGLRILNMWLSHWMKMDYCLNENSCRNVYSIVANNWQNPLSGVRKEIYKTFSTLLDVSCQSTKYTSESVLQHVMKDLSWRMKSKYFYLTILMPKVGVTKVLEDYPGIIPALIETLNAHHLSYSGADLYRVCLGELQDKESWCKWFMSPVMDLMLSDNENQLALQNLLSRWLPPTIRRFPLLSQMLLDRLVLHYRSGSNGDLPLCALLHHSRKEGFVTELWPKYAFIEIFLHSADEEVRKHSFAAVCKRAKKTVVPSSDEFEAVKNFLQENVNMDSGPFRQSVVDSFTHFLERLQESNERLVPEARANCNHELLLPALTFLNWLHDFLIVNLECGGNYQRKVTSLQLYLEVLRCFGPGQTKPSPSTNSIYLLAKELHFWKFDSESSWHCIVACVLDPSDDIQLCASLILSNHLKLLGEDGVTDRAKYIMKTAFNLCSSYLFYEVESGTMLVKLTAQFIQEKPSLSCIIPSCSNEVNTLAYEDILPEIFGDLSTKRELSLQEQLENLLQSENCDIIDDEKTSSSKQEKLIESETSSALHNYIEYCLFEAYRQWDAVQTDLYLAITRGTPLLGALSALEPLVPYFQERDITRTLCLATAASDHFLTLLAPPQAPGDAFSPSFAELTQAVELLIPGTEGRCDAATTGGSQLSPSHQLVLSCLCLSLKACCALAERLLRHQNASATHALHCLAIVHKILLRCRHKGTIESAGTALGNMVRHITSSKETRQCITSSNSNRSEKLSDVLEKMLLQVLTSISVYSAKTSITRRSAGVGILVHRIVAMDVRPEKPLLMLCLRHLCRVVEDLPLPPKDSFENVESCDRPQTSALHLLVRLAQEASLRQQMAPFASTVALLCFGAFADSAWTVQNAALQLFGALVPLLAGEKKVGDDEVEAFGCLTVEEFLSHHPTLARFLLDALRAAAAIVAAAGVAAATAAHARTAARMAAAIEAADQSAAATVTSDATLRATATATSDATRSATSAATLDAMRSATSSASATATSRATATNSATLRATASATQCATATATPSRIANASTSASTGDLMSASAFATEPVTASVSKAATATATQPAAVFGSRIAATPNASQRCTASTSATATGSALPRSSSYSSFSHGPSTSSGAAPETHHSRSLARRVAAASTAAAAATISASFAVGARVFRGATPPATSGSVKTPSGSVAFKTSSADVVFFPESAGDADHAKSDSVYSTPRISPVRSPTMSHGLPVPNGTLPDSALVTNGHIFPNNEATSRSNSSINTNGVTSAVTKNPTSAINGPSTSSLSNPTINSHVRHSSSLDMCSSDCPTLNSSVISSQVFNSECDESPQMGQFEPSPSKDVVPVLSLLSKLTLGDSWSTDAVTDDVSEMRKCFRILMKSSDLAVRKLAAKAYSRFLPPEQVYSSALILIYEIHGNEITKSIYLRRENEIHGMLTCLLYTVNRLAEDRMNIGKFECLLEAFVSVGLSGGSWVNRCLEVEIILKLEKLSGCSVSRQNCVSLVVDALNQVKKCSMTEVGVWSWAMQCVQYAAEMCKEDEVCYLWTIIYAANWPELAECFLSGVQNHVKDKLTKGKLLLVLVSSIFEKECNDSNLLTGIYKLVLDLTTSEKIVFTPIIYMRMFKVVRRENGLQCWSIALPLASGMFSLHVKGLLNLESEDLQFLEHLSNEIRDRSLPESCDAECRTHAAKAFVDLYNVLPRLRILLDKCKKIHRYISVVYILLDSAIAFLQDEDSDVRKEAAKFVFPERNSYTCLQTLLSVNNLSSLLSSFYIVRYYESRLFDFNVYEEALLELESKNDSLITVSPFDQGTSNIYAEETRILTLMSEAIISVLENKPSWPLNLISLPDIGKLTDVVTKLLPRWNISSKGTDLQILLIKLQALSRVCQIVNPSTSAEFKAIVDFASLFKENWV